MASTMFISVIILILLCVPIGVVLLIASAIPGIINPSFPVDTLYLVRNSVMAFDNTTLIAIPLFMLSGIIMAHGKIAKKIFDVFAYFIGDKTGGLPSAVVITCLFYGAISGSGPATTAAVGAMTIPILNGLGYDLKFCAAIVSVAGGLGVIIPPSIPFIMYSNSSSTSVGDMFIGGVLPGILIAAFLIVYTIYMCNKRGEDKEKILLSVNELRKKGFIGVFKDSFFALLTPVIILGGIYSGTVTPTEAALISVIYALLISLFIYKSIKIVDIIPCFIETARSLAPVMIIIGAASIFAKTIAILRIPQTVASMLGVFMNKKILLLLIINGFLLIVGCLLDTGAAILILTPILLPIVKSVGMDPVHFGIMMVVNLAIGFVTPPVGMNLYVAASMTNLKPMDIVKEAMPLLIMFFLALLVITFVPQLSLLLI